MTLVWEDAAAPRSRMTVTMSTELTRIANLPRRPQVALDEVKGDALTLHMTGRLGRHRASSDPCACRSLGRQCITSLYPAQAWALFEAPLTGGVVGPIGVGHGKTALDILVPLVYPGCRLAVLFILAGHQQTLISEYLIWREHFQVPSLVIGDVGYVVPGRPVLHVYTYSALSRPESTDLLEKMAPDLIIADEAHNLRDRKTARTGRLLRLFAKQPKTRLCFWSGTLLKKSIKDYAHLSALALRSGSPLPIDPEVVSEWAAAIDPSDWKADPGALRVLSDGVENVEQALHRRIVETYGVIATQTGSVDASIQISERKIKRIPQEIENLIHHVRRTWVRPDGEELVDGLEVMRVLRELAAGFYYRWKFPRGESERQIEDWREARKYWHKELREKNKNGRAHLDSPRLCTLAAMRAWQEVTTGIKYTGDLPVWKARCWLDWYRLKDTVQPETETVWVHDFLAKDAADWGLKERGIIWYEHQAFGKRVGELSGLPVHGGGVGAESRILDEDGSRSIVASIKAHGTGRNGLQFRFNRQLITCPPANGHEWEQLIGRLHRPGQEADEVINLVYRHTEEMAASIDTAVRQARFIKGIMGGDQKLLVANCDFPI